VKGVIALRTLVFGTTPRRRAEQHTLSEAPCDKYKSQDGRARAREVAVQARFLRLSDRIGQVGLEGEPHVKHLEGKLWELRLTGREGIARALYVTAIGRRVVVVRAFVKKTQKTPPTEIKLALRRAKEIT
jgi:phage-related protein